MKQLRFFMEIMGWILTGTVFHEIYHTLAGGKIFEVGYKSGSGFFVTSANGSSEVIAFYITVAFVILGIILTIKEQK